MYKKCQVVMLATKDTSYLILTNKNKLILNSRRISSENDFISQHLYILSDDEIKEGDWAISYSDDESFESVYQCKDISLVDKEDKKIIATTDTSISIMDKDYPKLFFDHFPRPSDSFIKKYIEEYNKGNQITDVLVEYEAGYYQSTTYDQPDIWINEELKTDSENTITIKKVKDTYTREEVLKMLDDVLNLGMTVRQNQLSGYEDESGKEKLETWIKENL